MGIGKLASSDFVKGAWLAVLCAVLTGVAQALSVPGFSFSSFDWEQILRIAGVAFTGYISKNLLSSSNGAVMGKFGGSNPPKK